MYYEDLNKTKQKHTHTHNTYTQQQQILFYFSRPFITYLEVMFHNFMEQVKSKERNSKSESRRI